MFFYHLSRIQQNSNIRLLVISKQNVRFDIEVYNSIQHSKVTVVTRALTSVIYTKKITVIFV